MGGFFQPWEGLKMANQNVTKLLQRIERDLTTAVAFLDNRGFTPQTELLDKAADNVERVLDALDSLKDAA
jgi:hypothetical protein